MVRTNKKHNDTSVYVSGIVIRIKGIMLIFFVFSLTDKETRWQNFIIQFLNPKNKQAKRLADKKSTVHHQSVCPMRRLRLVNLKKI